MVSGPLTIKDYRSGDKPTWCPGCGDFGVLSATYKAMTQLQLKPHETVAVSGIGCSSRLPYFLRTYGLHGLHGRALPLAQGVKLANPSLTVLAFGGDGDLFSIGAGHMPHAANRNIDITCVLMDNAVYGLTKGQTSPTSPLGHKTKSTPYGSVTQPLNPVLLALSFGASFVARGYSAKPAQLVEIMVKAIQHHGFAFVDVDSPCTEFYNTFNFLDSVVEDLPADHDRTDLGHAIELARHESKRHLGIYYQVERQTYEDGATQLVSQGTEFDAAAYLKRYA